MTFLFERGASLKQAMLNGKLVVDKIQTRKAIEKDSDKSNYWTKVEEQMTTKRGVKDSLKSLFGWTANP